MIWRMRLRAVGDELSSEESATFRLMVEGRTQELHPIVRDELYRITREALRNAFSHAQAQHIEVELTYADRLRLRIRDDGGGIPPEILEAGRSGHYGLAGMRERARQIDATLDIWSGAGKGHGDRVEHSRLDCIREKRSGRLQE